jgi:hypothetical protein
VVGAKGAYVEVVVEGKRFEEHREGGFQRCDAERHERSTMNRTMGMTTSGREKTSRGRAWRAVGSTN